MAGEATATGAAVAGPWGALGGAAFDVFAGGGFGVGSSAPPPATTQIQDQTFSYGAFTKSAVSTQTAVILSAAIIGGVVLYAFAKK